MKKILFVCFVMVMKTMTTPLFAQGNNKLVCHDSTGFEIIGTDTFMSLYHYDSLDLAILDSVRIYLLNRTVTLDVTTSFQAPYFRVRMNISNTDARRDTQHYGIHYYDADTIRYFCNVPSVLPLDLVSFRAQYVPNDKKNHIQWSTAQEIGHDYFLLERSSDGIRFDAVNKQVTRGKSQVFKTYRVIDPQTPTTDMLYRLISVSQSGVSDTSKTIFVKQFKVMPFRLIQDNGSSYFALSQTFSGSFEVNVFALDGSLLRQTHLVSGVPLQLPQQKFVIIQLGRAHSARAYVYKMYIP